MRFCSPALLFSTILLAGTAFAAPEADSPAGKEPAKPVDPYMTPVIKQPTKPKVMELIKTDDPAALNSTPAHSTIITPSSKPLRPNDPDSPVTAELKDGSQAVFRSDGHIMIVRPNGMRLIPPDGILTLKDGTTFAVQDGQRVQ